MPTQETSIETAYVLWEHIKHREVLDLNLYDVDVEREVRRRLSVADAGPLPDHLRSQCFAHRFARCVFRCGNALYKDVLPDIGSPRTYWGVSRRIESTRAVRLRNRRGASRVRFETVPQGDADHS